MSVLPPKPRDHRAKAPSRVQVAEEMFQTLQEMTTQVAFQVSRQASLEALGPFAALFEEFMARQAALEDFVGFTYVPKHAGPTVGATNGATVGDSTGGPSGVAAARAEQSASAPAENPEAGLGSEADPYHAPSNGHERRGSTPHLGGEGSA